MVSTNLDFILRQHLHANQFVIAGHGTDTVIESTVRDAVDMG